MVFCSGQFDINNERNQRKLLVERNLKCLKWVKLAAAILKAGTW